jgi:hypothetical protein
MGIPASTSCEREKMTPPIRAFLSTRNRVISLIGKTTLGDDPVTVIPRRTLGENEFVCGIGVSPVAAPRSWQAGKDVLL